LEDHHSVSSQEKETLMKAARWQAFKLGMVVLAVAFLLAPHVALAQAAEAAKVRVLLALDTDDKEGRTWGLDGENMRALIEHMVKKQGLEGRVVIDHFIGAKVTPQFVLDFFRKLDVGPNDAVMFYFSGHGAYDKKKGHFMAFKRGFLFREALLTAMDKKKPRLRVVLTDCCANYTDQRGMPGLPGDLSAAMLFGPHAAQVGGDPDPARRPPTGVNANSRDTPASPPSARNTEPPSKEYPLPPDSFFAAAKKKAKVEEPGFALTRGVILRTAKGGVPFEKVLEKTDGKTLRDLLFRTVGLVDINGCMIGKLSLGTEQWGGSVFTNAFILLQDEPATKLGGENGDAVSWEGFFPRWQQLTDELARAYTNKQASQQPYAWKLGEAK
jgi:Caspase domain